MLISSSPSRFVLSLALVGAGACAQDRAPVAREARAAQPPVETRTPVVQVIADGVVFAPRMTERFLAASRKKRLLVDIGRVDIAKLDAEQLATLRRVSARTGPFAGVTHLRVRGSWGEETDSIVGYDVWNGRAVAVLAASPGADSLLKKNASLIAVATRAVSTDSLEVPAAPVKQASATTSAPVKQAGAAIPPPPPVCVRDSIAPQMQTRVTTVRDSLQRWVTDSLRSPFIRFAKAATVRGEAALGCFGGWRAVVVVTSRTPGFEWNEERTLLVAPDGKVQTARLRDLRLRAHESLLAFDADGDGVDELSTRGLATRMGAQSILKLDPATRRFARFASGFAWESR
ncbi:MAG: hypothetical protein JF589_04815 [Gemmatimonadetes bacterium]|nr:hypothetical protein [Gemmatimonadota bacterium]